MTLNLSVKHDLDGLAKTLNRKQRKDLPKAFTRAMNKTAANVQTEVKRDVAKATGIAIGTVGGALKLDKATFSKLAAKIEASGKTLNLIRFATPAAIRNYRKQAGLKAKGWGKKARVFPGVFVGNKGRTAFIRTGAGKKIRPAHGPSIPRAMVSDKVEKQARLVILRKWPKNFRHEVSRILERKR